MKKLSEGELWDRVRGLEGKTIETIRYHEPVKITQVTHTTVGGFNLKRKKSRSANFDEVYGVYSFLFREKRITSDERGLVPGHPKHRGNGFYILAVLAEAISDQAKIIQKGKAGLKICTCTA